MMMHTVGNYAQKRLLIAALTWFVLAGPVAAQITVEQVLGAVVRVESEVPADARTAGALGTERHGSGVVIGENGLVLTIGYLIMESSSVMVSDKDGNMVRAEVIAYHNETGFGLLRAGQSLDIEPVELGDSSTLGIDDRVMIVGYGGARDLSPATVASRRVFSGYWEYLLESAIFTEPPHPGFGGAALIGPGGRLMGIGSLVVQDAAVEGEADTPGNMFVPIDLLKPILGELLVSGRTSAARRPWLGMLTDMFRGHLFVVRVADEGPAELAGVQTGDIVLKVAGQPVTDMQDLFRKIWALGKAGVDVPLTLLRSAEILDVRVKSADRYQWLKLSPTPTPGGGNVASL